MMLRMKTFSDQLRAAIDGSGLTRYRIARLAKLPESTLSRFAHGKPMTTDSLDAVARVLKMKVVAERSTTGAAKRPKKGR